MTIEILQPASREDWLLLRQATLGASEMPAVLGVHPHRTPFEEWAHKSGLVPSQDNKQMRRGNWLQPVAVGRLREERPNWIVTENVIGSGGKVYRDLNAGLSCTPDAFVIDPMRDLGISSIAMGVCQIKTVNPHTFQSDWMLDGDIQVPPYVAIQAIQEACLTGASWACVAALVGFDLDMHILDVDIHPGIIARIKRAAPDFLRRVRENDPPPPDYARDGAVIADLYADDDDDTISLTGLDDERYGRLLKLLARREAMKEIEGAATEAEKERRTIDAELIHMLGNAARGVLADGRIIEAKTVRRKGFTVEPTSYRAIKIKQRKVA